MTRLLTVTMLLLGTAGFTLAAVTVPEIDPTSGAAAIVLLSGGLLVLRSRRH